jgi:hypothetical protein
MPITLNGDTGITAPTYAGTVAAEYSVPVTAFKNRIINGAMQIDQRNNGASVTQSNSVLIFPVDRTFIFGSVTSRFTAQRNAGSVTPPVGFVNYLGATVASAYSVTASDFFFLEHRIEGFNTADLNWGTANAQTVTLSFWVRSSITGTNSGVLQNADFTRTYPFTYTVASANTWEYKTITIVGDTTGTWNTTNSTGIGIRFNLGTGSNESKTAGAWASGGGVAATGSVSIVGTSGATFYITGVQLEKGSTATSFDYRPYGTELVLCQRYFEAVPTVVNASGGLFQNNFYKVNKRTAPTLALVFGSISPATLNSRDVNYFTIDGLATSNAVVSVTATAEL